MKSFRPLLAAASLALFVAAPASACCGGGGRAVPAASETAPENGGGALLAEAARWLGSRNPTGTVGPWCADFVSFVLKRVGLQPLAGRMAADGLRYGPRLAGPRVGALAILRTRRGAFGHIGFVEQIEPDGSIVLLSGNWGRRVARSLAPRSAVTAFVAVGSAPEERARPFAIRRSPFAPRVKPFTLGWRRPAKRSWPRFEAPSSGLKTQI